jgi:hypothetical protein
VKYLTLTTALLAGAWIGALAGRSAAGPGASPSPPGRYLEGASVAALVLGLVGELIYARELILDPAQLLVAFRYASVAELGVTARASRLVGLSSLSNLLLVPLAIHGQLLFAEAGPRVRRRARWVVGGTLVVLVLHALLLAGRMAAVNAALVVAAAWLARPPLHRARRRSGQMIVLAAAVAFLIWAGETLRGGVTYAIPRGLSPFGAEAQAHVGERFAQGYFGADLNNAFTILECDPEMQVVGSTALQFLIPHPMLPDDCPLWQSAYGTMNIVGLAWWDLGWFAFPALAVAGALLGLLYGRAAQSTSQATRLLFLIAVPGYAGLLRINWYASTAFLIPLGFLLAVALLTATFRGLPAPPPRAEFGSP